MENGWIKLHRKILNSDIIKDQTAWHIFTWLLLKVDKETGKKTIGRFWASEELGVNSNTFYKALKRLEKKYKVLTQNSNNKFTEISLINWHKYQIGNTSGNNKVTTKEQQSNTLQEYKNKELRIEEDQQKIPNRLILSRGMVIAYAKEYPGITTTEIKEQRLKCNSYMNMSSETYKNPGLFFRKWLDKYMKDKKILNNKKTALEEITSHLPQISEEERLRNLEKLAEMKKKLSIKVVND